MLNGQGYRSLRRASTFDSDGDAMPLTQPGGIPDGPCHGHIRYGDEAAIGIGEDGLDRLHDHP